MKRLIFVASLAILAAACQKTEIQNEVQTPISFSTETGKQTRAITQDSENKTYPTDQPFGVYAYGHQGDEDPTLVMDNVEVVYGTEWKANTTGNGGPYYWPNDPTTTIDFYAFSPYIQRPAGTNPQVSASAEATKNGVAHQVMTVESLSHTEPVTTTITTDEGEEETTTTGGLSFAGYVHDNIYVDFMEAIPVKGATYSSPGGTGTSGTGKVPMTFSHKMTQVVFNVTTDKVYPGVFFTVESIKLKNIKDKASYNTYTGWSPAFSNETAHEVQTVFPADSKNGAAVVNAFAKDENNDNTTIEDVVVLDYSYTDTEPTECKSMSTTPVTMIPQNMQQATTDYVPGEDKLSTETTAQMFEIVYSIEGEGVAKETVTKHVPFFAKEATSAVDWKSNMKITYTVKIGLNEITFDPSVADWSSTDGNTYYIPESTTPTTPTP